MPKVKSVIIRNKKNSPKEKPQREAAQSEQDWLNEERTELQPMKPSLDIINMAVGRDFCITPHKRDNFRFKDGQPFRVLRFYPGTPEILIDKPETEKEMLGKEEFFASTPLVYVAIKPFEALTPEELREKLEAAVELKRKAA